MNDPAISEHERDDLNARMREARAALTSSAKAAQDRIAVIAVALAERMGASDADLLAIRWAAESEGIDGAPKLPTPTPMGLRCLAIARGECPVDSEVEHLEAVLAVVQPLGEEA